MARKTSPSPSNRSRPCAKSTPRWISTSIRAATVSSTRIAPQATTSNRRNGPSPARSISSPGILPEARAVAPQAHLALIEAERMHLAAHPLSTRQARLVAALLDVMADRFYAAHRENPELILFATDRADYRRKVLAASPAMALIAALAEGYARLATIAHRVPDEAVSQMDVRDFMVS